MLRTVVGPTGIWPCELERGFAMETPNAGNTPIAREAPKKVSAIRKVISPILLVAATAVAVLEFRAFYAVDRAVKRLESAQEEDKRNKRESTITKERVQALVGRAPVGPGEKDGMIEKEVYVWRGLFRTYHLTASYEGGDEPRMVNFSID
jgi:hypothetical protein